MKIEIKCTEPQIKFHTLKCRYGLFVGGYGSGKTQSMANQAFIDATHSSNAQICLYEPTFDLVDLTLAPRLIELLDKHEVLHTYNKAKHIIETRQRRKQMGDFVLRSLDKPEKIVSYQMYRSHIDELDTLPLKKAIALWDKIMGRTRQVPRGFTRNTVVNRVCCYTTPEGFNFAHQKWIKEKSNDNEYGYVRASSHSNPFLPKSYIDSLLKNYTAQLAEAYIDGNFVNMKSGTVYSSYNRAAHYSYEVIKPKEPLFIGLDFNVGKMAASIYVKRDGGKQWHAASELVDVMDTPEMIRIIQDRYQNNGHRIIIYPDATGRSRDSTNANTSDIAMLQQAKFEVRANPTNPSVRDRINSMNIALSKGRVFVNSDECPTIANCLEQQCWDKNGEPDKSSGVDHQNDASTYPIAYEMPIQKPMGHINVRF